MPTIRRAVILAGLAALSLVACSSDDDEPEVSTPEVTSAEESPADVSIPDITQPEITLPDASIPDLSIPDLSDISIPDLSDISIPDLSDISIPANVEEAMRDALAGLGLDDEQVDCLVERIDIAGGEVPDVNDVMGSLEECGIEITDLQPG